MPYLPKPNKKPWVPERKAQEGRKEVVLTESGQRFYDSKQWRRLRKSFLAENSLCIDCQREGILTPATVADHIQRVRVRPDLALEWSNLSPLCERHHAVKSSKERHEK